MLAAIDRQNLFYLRVSRKTLWRGLAAGAAWGVSMGIGFAALEAWQCGAVCLPDAALTTWLSIGAGIVGIGPVVAFGRRV
ncbi:MAG TPA: hypothetical protein VGD13_00190 [Xanthobacteraceae bacterium]|jgi:hypothetical protein